LWHFFHPIKEPSISTSGGDFDGEVGWGEEGENLGGGFFAAVVHALAEPPLNISQSNSDSVFSAPKLGKDKISQL